MTKYNKSVLGIILGALSGYFLGKIVFVSFFAEVEWHPNVVQVLTYVVCMAIFIVLAILLMDIIVIISTSFLGAYAFIRGISIFAGGFPNEGTM
ncbi:MAG: TMEM198/TM7SF3 family protein [archaeon]|nr:TMEM198/TM7SF3 family protein [archaeon]